jgi:hypothetical protein
VKQRVLAIAGAVILICGAILVGLQFGGSDDDGTTSGADPGGDLPVVACTPDLAAVCERLADEELIASRPPTFDLDDLDAQPEDLDAWITWDPGPRVAGFATGDDGWGTGEPLGSAPLALATVPNGLDPDCEAAPTWSCVAADGASGAALGIGSPATAEGLARIAPLVDALELDDFDQLAAEIDDIADGPTRGQSDASSMTTQLVTTPGALDGVIAPRGLAERRASTPQGQARDVGVLIPTAPGAATVVVATAPGGDAPEADDLCEAAAEPLEALGLVACRGSVMTDELAGLLYQVHERVG